jgi:hypothetical protein
MGCTHHYFKYEDPIHYAELRVCPLSGTLPACQYPEHHRDEREEDCKQYRIQDTPEEVGDFACVVANPVKANKGATVGPET